MDDYTEHSSDPSSSSDYQSPYNLPGGQNNFLQDLGMPSPDPLGNLNMPTSYSNPYQQTAAYTQAPTVGSAGYTNPDPVGLNTGIAPQAGGGSYTGALGGGYSIGGTTGAAYNPGDLSGYYAQGNAMVKQLQAYHPQLSQASQTELQAALAQLGLAQPAMATAQGIINSGGTTAPNYAQQLQSIQGNYQQNLQQGNANLMQQQANTGQTGMVQGQQLNALGQRLNTQEQNEISQAQQFDVATAQKSLDQAMNQMTGANSVLGQIAQQQYQNDQASQQAMLQAQQIMQQMTQTQLAVASQQQQAATQAQQFQQSQQAAAQRAQQAQQQRQQQPQGYGQQPKTAYQDPYASVSPQDSGAFANPATGVVPYLGTGGGYVSGSQSGDNSTPYNGSYGSMNVTVDSGTPGGDYSGYSSGGDYSGGGDY